VRPAVRSALGAVRSRGIQVVVCTGRRYASARPIIEALGLPHGPAVLQNGGLVADTRSGQVLERNLLPPALYPAAFALLAQTGRPLVYVHDGPPGVDFFSEALERLHPHARRYVEDHLDCGRIVESLDEAPGEATVMLSCMADEAPLRALRPRIHAELGDGVRTHLLRNRYYEGFILETASAQAGKWSALERVAARAGIPASEILAIGDDDNDAEMIASAGLGIAMGDAPAAVRASADWVAPTSDEDGLVYALERFVFGA
jgi:Cof subfamily protein (haloacid dehalogenase superfamily)